MLRINPLKLFCGVCVVAMTLAASGLAFAEPGDAVRYSREDDQVILHGPFGVSTDRIVIPFVVFDNGRNGPISLKDAQQAAGSFFALRIGTTFSELFGESEAIDLNRFRDEARPSELTYDYASLRGACLRKSNGKTAVMIDLSNGGTVNAGNPADTLFIFESRDGQVRYEVINRDDWTDAGCLDEAREAAGLAASVQAAERELIAKTAPLMLEALPDDLPFTLDIKTLSGSPARLIRDHLTRFSGYYFPEFCAPDGAEHEQECAKSKSGFEQVFESTRYDIYRLRLVRFCDSAGVDFLHDKERGAWIALFNNIPGCAKYYLCQPDYHVVEANSLSADLPDGCMNWGDWRQVTIDLETFEVHQR